MYYSTNELSTLIFRKVSLLFRRRIGITYVIQAFCKYLHEMRMYTHILACRFKNSEIRFRFKIDLFFCWDPGLELSRNVQQRTYILVFLS